MKAVKVVRDPETIRLPADLVRRNTAANSAVESLTQKQQSQINKIKEAKVGSHGILERYYEPTAKAVVIAI